MPKNNADLKIDSLSLFRSCRLSLSLCENLFSVFDEFRFYSDCYSNNACNNKVFVFIWYKPTSGYSDRRDFKWVIQYSAAFLGPYLIARVSRISWWPDARKKRKNKYSGKHYLLFFRNNLIIHSSRKYIIDQFGQNRRLKPPQRDLYVLFNDPWIFNNRSYYHKTVIWKFRKKQALNVAIKIHGCL